MWAIEKHATIDFETYSEAGFVWDEATQSWRALKGAPKKGLKAVGTCAYAEHPSTEVITLSYKLPGPTVVKRWRPGQPLPWDLFAHIAAGGLVESHNWLFEFSIWYNQCGSRYGFPELPMHQMRCSAAKARVNSLPGALEKLTAVLPTKVKKNPDGTRLINKFSVPRKPTKANPSKRTFVADDPEDAERFYAYCDDDVRAEIEASDLTMPMSINELRFWQLDQRINWRGVGVDRPGVRDMIAVLEEAQAKYGAECAALTGGLEPSQVQALQGWLAAQGVRTDTLDSDAIDDLLTRDLPPVARRVLEIRQLVGSASVKKLYAIERSSSRDDRVRGVIIHHGARTGRPTGELFQPLNLPKAGPDLIYCECGKPSKSPSIMCPWCGARLSPVARKYKWGDVPKGYTENPVDHVLTIMATRSLDLVELFFGDALLAISGCVRGMVVAGPGNDLVASDYTAIEAVVTAALAKCQWRLDVFKRKEDIYLASASRATGTPIEVYLKYKEETGSNHPDRNNIGKYAELACGFGGWVGGWRGFDTSDNLTDDEVKKLILAWRAASPEIVEMWGGQSRGRPWDNDFRLERFGFEGAFINAVQYPGQEFESHGIRFYMRGDALIIRLLSGRELTYHSPRLWPSTRTPGTLEITYMTWNSNPKYGPIGWGPMKTYAGRIAENIIQATAHDIQRYGIEALEAAGYPIVLHVYDENIAEVPLGFGSIEEFETIMSRMPPYANDWPIAAHGGWRGRRYRKA